MPEEEQKPFLFLRVCPTCGYWKITNSMLDIFVLIAGATHMCPNDGQVLYMVLPEDELSVKRASPLIQEEER